MQQAVEDGGGDDGIAEHLAPLAEGLVGGEQDAAAFVAGGDELEEQGGAEFVEREVAELVDDEQLRCELDAQAALESAFLVRDAEVFEESVHAGEVHAVAVLDGLNADGHGEMRLPDSGRSEQDEVVGVRHEAEAGELHDLLAVDVGLGV